MRSSAICIAAILSARLLASDARTGVRSGSSCFPILSFFDLLEMQEELETIFGRKVDLVEKEGLRNPIRRKSILKNREIVYAA